MANYGDIPTSLNIGAGEAVRRNAADNAFEAYTPGAGGGITPALSGSNGSFSYSTATFGNLNGMSFYTSNGSMVASYTVPNVPAQTEYLFSNSNGITFGTNGSTVTASHNGLTSQSNQAVSGSNGSFAFQTVTFGNLNGMSFYTSNGSLVASYTVPTQSVQTQGMVSINGGTGDISFSNSNGITFGRNASTVTASHNGITSQTNQTLGGYFVGNTTGQSSSSTVDARSLSVDGAGIVSAGWSNGSIRISATQSNQAFSASGGSSTFQTLSFANGNGATFSNNGGSVQLSYTVPTVTQYFSATNTTFNGTNVSGSLTLNTNGLRVDLSAGAGGGVTPVASASNGSFSFTTLGFSNANNVTFGTSAGSIVTASVAAPGAAAENNWVHALGANTAGNTTASGSTIGYSGINITLSGTNNSVMNISAPATSSLSATGQVSISTNGSTISIGVPAAMTASRYKEFKESPLVAGEIGQASLHIQPWLIPNLHMDRVVAHKLFSNASNSSNSFTVSDWVGIYTRNVSTLSLLHSVSTSTNFTGSGTVGSYLSYGGGIKALTMGLTQTLTEGMYWLGVIQRTTTGGGAGHTLNQALNSNINSSYRGLMGAATNATNQMTLGFGVYTASTSAMPASIAFTQINGNSSVFQRPPSIYLVSGTI